MVIRLIVFLLFVNGSNLFGNTDSLEAVLILEENILTLEDADFNSVNEKFDKALNVFKCQDDLFNWFTWHLKFGQRYRRIQSHKNALFYFRKGLNEAWRLHTGKEELNKKAILHVRIGALFKNNLNDFENAKIYYEKFKILYRDSLQTSEIKVAKYVYIPLGNVYWGLRDEEKAVYYYELAQEIFRKNNDWYLYSKVCRNQGLFYTDIEKYEDAQLSFEKALVLLDSLSLYEQISLFNDKGLSFYNSGQFTLAEQFTKKAYDLVKQNITAFDKEEAETFRYDYYFNMGRISKALCQFDQGENFDLQALKILEDSKSGRNNREIVTLHNNLGRLFFEKGDFAKSEYYYQLAVSLISTALGEIVDPQAVPDELLIGENQLAYAYSELGALNLEAYKNSQSIEILKTGIAYLKLADKVNQLQIQGYSSELSDLQALAKQRNLKESLQFALFELNAIAPSISHLKDMFQYSERCRSFLLLNQKMVKDNLAELNKTQRLAYEELKESKKKLEEEFFVANSALEELSAIEASRWKSEMFKLDDLIQRFEHENKISLSGYLESNKLLERIQTILAKDQALIEYFIGEDHIYIYLITQKKFNVFRKRITDKLRSSIDELGKSLLEYDHTNPAIETHSCDLYGLLLQDIFFNLNPNIKRLVIIRDQNLSLIPFDIFPVEACKNESATQAYRLLIERFAIGYAYSAEIFLLQSARKASNAEHKFIGFAPSYKSENFKETESSESKLIATLVRSGTYELKGAEEEVAVVAKMLAGQAMFKEEATEANFKSKANDHAIILLSMHGLINLQQPNFSELLFGTAKTSESSEDNLLRPIEIYPMDLTADLVVLSACDTGNGKLYPGEGVFSFARAFTAAGVPSTMMTLWKVEDNSTSELIISFFDYLKRGLTKDVALQKAKIKYLEKNKNNRAALHPYFWSGIQLSGNTQNIDIGSTLFSNYGFYLILFLTLFLFIYWKYFSKKGSRF